MNQTVPDTRGLRISYDDGWIGTDPVSGTQMQFSPAEEEIYLGPDASGERNTGFYEDKEAMKLAENLYLVKVDIENSEDYRVILADSDSKRLSSPYDKIELWGGYPVAGHRGEVSEDLGWNDLYGYIAAGRFSETTGKEKSQDPFDKALANGGFSGFMEDENQ